ncbi:hypothetical protein A6769_36095 [Nostoc punctiforme NIES-2108]|uniref:Uncharacterized protein n=1 Tax=Nostoc punctiforme NIES-2108 TaxID=1356359 RepID=A0A367R0U5_NOSPU|nr:hypothetical protein A6769_36095 [Nostoc punctiforme NIES-2108]
MGQGVQHLLNSPHPFIQLYHGFALNKRAIPTISLIQRGILFLGSPLPAILAQKPQIPFDKQSICSVQTFYQ